MAREIRIVTRRYAAALVAREIPLSHILQPGRGSRGVAKLSQLVGRVGYFLEIAVDSEANVADEVHIAAPMSHRGRAARVGSRGSFHGTSGDRAILESPLLDSAVADEGAENQGVRGHGSEEDLDRGVERAALLAPVVPDDVGDSVQCDGDRAQAKREEEDKLDLPPEAHLALDDDRDGEEDEQKIGKHVAGGHGYDLGEALPALRTGVWQYLPVMGEGTAFGQVGDDDGDKRGYQSAADGEQRQSVRPLPVSVEPFEEFQNGAFQDP